MGALRAMATALVVAAAVFIPTVGSEPAPEVVTTEVLGAQVSAPDPVVEPEPGEVPPGDVSVAPTGEPPTDEPAATSTGASSELEALVYRSAVELGLSSPGVGVSVTVSHAGEVVSVASGVPYDPASAAKLYWVVAAVAAAGVDAVEPHAEALFADSDNQAASEVIDLIGVDAINDFTAAAGMGDTYLSLWVAGGVRRTGVEAAAREFRNTSTTADAVSFLEQLAAHELLDLADTAQVMAWMTLSPDGLDDPTMWGGVLTDRLPPDVAALTMHKAGWLTPGCCVSVENELTALGLVPLPDGTRFAIAVTTVDGADYEGQAAWISQLTADIYDRLAIPA